MAVFQPSTFALRGRASLDPNEDQMLIRHWLLEESLVRIRWATIPITLLLIPLFSTVSLPLVVMLAITIGAGNIGLTRLLSGDFCGSRLHLVKCGATLMDWAITVGSIALFSPELSNWTPALLLLLILTTATRYGQLGVVITAVVATFTVTGLIAAELFILGVYETPIARDAWLGWTLLILVATSIGSGVVRAKAEYNQWEQDRWVHYGSILPRFRLGISEREAELLPFLARKELTYRQIADELNRSPETIKSHVRHLGAKLGVSGRNQVVLAAQQHGLLPSIEKIDEPK